MKKIFLLATAVASLALVACNKDAMKTTVPPAAQGEQMGSIDITIQGETPLTKAVTAYTATETYETQVNKLEILVFNASGALENYKAVTSPTITSGAIASQSITCTTGAKKVYAVINAPSSLSLGSVTTETAFKNKTSSLGNNSRTASTGFVMMGCNLSVNVTGENTACAITAKRLAFRFCLQKVTNNSNLGALTIKGVFIINSGSSVKLSMSNATTWPTATTAGYNVAGKKASSSDFVTSSTTSDIPAMLWQEPASATAIAQSASTSWSKPLMVYGYPNSTAATGTNPVRLVVLATLAGADYYYPMTIAAPKANQTYTIELAVTGIGSDDPNVEVSKGSANVTVTVSGWDSQTGQEFTI